LLIAPFFRELGFDESEIQYETKFEIRLGRGTHSIETTEEDKKRGFLDILFKRNDDNLFVVEVKHEDHILNENDVLQAISYARLLPQIAPFCIVTNGKETKLIDTITTDEIKNIVKSNYVLNGYKIELNPEIRYQALKNLISINKENIILFSKKQVERNINYLRGDKSDINKKYIPDLYVRREGLLDSFYKFLESEKTVFSITGKSGYGKTNSVCNLIQHFIEIHPILFLNGSRIYNDLFSHIQYEFDWDFGKSISNVDLIKRIIDIFSISDSKLIIFIDAIDESSYDNFALNLDEIIKCISEKKIKICVSCKDTSWSSFISIKGLPSKLLEESYITLSNINSSFEISEFSRIELDQAIIKYKNIYDIPEIKGITKKLCENPLMLRVICELYQSQKEMPDDARTPLILSEYIKKILEKSDNRPRDIFNLSQIGRQLFDQNLFSINETDIKIERISEYLFSFNLLKRTIDDKGRHYISFQYDHIRDFIISYHSLELDKLKDEELLEIIKLKIGEDLANQIFTYYEKYADEKKRDIIRNEFSSYNYQRAIHYVESYQTIIDRDFAQIKNRFHPHTDTEIGLLVFYHTNIFYRPIIGFRERKGRENKVIWLEKENWFEATTEQERYQIAQKYDVTSLFPSSQEFITINPEECAQNEIISQLKDIVKYRALDETKNIAILEENVLNFFSRNYRDLGYEIKEDEYWFNLLPLSYEELIKRTLKLIQEYIIRISEIIRDIYIPTEYLNFYYKLKIISKHKKEIKNTILPFPKEVSRPRLSASYYNRYNDDEILDYVCKLYYNTYNEYMILVETNFPTIKNRMKRYNMSPWHVIGEIKNEQESKEWSYITIIPSDDHLILDFTLKSEESRFNPETFEVQTEIGTKKLESYHGTLIHGFFEGDSGKDNIIQHLVYEILEDDLKQIYNWDIF